MLKFHTRDVKPLIDIEFAQNVALQPVYKLTDACATR